MRILICGTGKIARELLKRLGEGWRVTLIDKDKQELDKCHGLFPNIEAVHQEDASSPVVLDEVDVGGFDYVLAMTGNDEVNRVIAEYAEKKQAGHVSVLIHEADNRDKFKDLDAHTIMASTMVAQSLYYYLQDPRVRVTPIASGPATIMEFEAVHHFRAVGRKAKSLNTEGSRLVAIYRGQELIYPDGDTKIMPEDKLVIMGDTETFPQVCDLLECGQPHFPLAYGAGLLVALPREDDEGKLNAILDEGLFISQNTKVKNIRVLCSGACLAPIEERIKDWPHAVEKTELAAEGGVADQVRDIAGQGGFGLIVIPSPSKNLLSSLLSASMTELAKDLDCPLLVARGSAPYKKVLLPFNGAEYAEQALEVTIDLARQLGVEELDAAVVSEPGFITGDDDDHWLESVTNRLDELAHIHKMRIGRQIRKGNPVNEISALSEDYDLIVIGSGKTGKGFLSPNVAEHLARKTACSALLVP